MDVPAVVRKLLSSSRAADLHELLIGTSPYSVAEGGEDQPTDSGVGNAEDYQSLLKAHQLWTLAGYHLAFLAKYGDSPSGVWEGGKFISPFPSEFSQWLESGCPGLSLPSLVRYLQARPLAD